MFRNLDVRTCICSPSCCPKLKRLMLSWKKQAHNPNNLWFWYCFHLTFEWIFCKKMICFLFILIWLGFLVVIDLFCLLWKCYLQILEWKHHELAGKIQSRTRHLPVLLYKDALYLLSFKIIFNQTSLCRWIDFSVILTDIGNTSNIVYFYIYCC